MDVSPEALGGTPLDLSRLLGGLLGGMEQRLRFLEQEHDGALDRCFADAATQADMPADEWSAVGAVGARVGQVEGRVGAVEGRVDAVESKTDAGSAHALGLEDAFERSFERLHAAGAGAPVGSGRRIGEERAASLAANEAGAVRALEEAKRRHGSTIVSWQRAIEGQLADIDAALGELGTAEELSRRAAGCASSSPPLAPSPARSASSPPPSTDASPLTPPLHPFRYASEEVKKHVGRQVSGRVHAPILAP